MRLKPLLVIVIVAVAVIVALFSYVGSALHGIAPAPPAKPVVAPSIGAILISKNQLSYDQNRYLVPSVEVGYGTINVSNLYINATLFASPPPKSFFILNMSNDCFNCPQAGQMVNLLASYLDTYGLLQNSSSISLINRQNLTTMPNGSELIILNGVLPQYMIEYAPNTSETMIQYLLGKGTDIIYVGRNFANVSNGRILIPTTEGQLPYFLLWNANSSPYQGIPYYFTARTFSLLGGKGYGPLGYISAANGSMLVFSNYLSSWNNASDAAQDIAKASAQLFWLPQYAQAGTSLSLPNFASSSGRTELPLRTLSMGFSTSSALSTRIAYGRVTLYNTANYSVLQPSDIYNYVYYTQNFTSNGTILLPAYIVPGAQIPTSITIDTGSNVPIRVAPHLTMYSLNLTPVQSILLQPFTEAGNFTQIQLLSFQLPPGEYIAQVQGFYGKQYAAALFNISQVHISLVSANYTSGSFLLLLTSNTTPLSGINYTIDVNGLYPSAGVLTNGTIAYHLPAGTPTLKGAVAFNVSMLSRTFAYSTSNAPPTIHINNQYVELAIVAIFAIIIVTVVKAPNRDEFYIDVPSIREEREIAIKIRAQELVSVFDKQNIYYRWRYMPLSIEEVRRAIANNISMNNIAVSLTYSNVELLLTQLAAKGLLVSADELYAPKAWVQKSGHDIEYLATFKKLRLYFVSHAYQFNDVDANDSADIVATAHNERAYVVIYSRTSKFQKVPVFPDAKTYIAFLNADRMDDFMNYLRTTGKEVEELKIYLAAGQVKLIDADNPGETLT